MNDLGTISRELSDEPESLRRSILSSMAKLKGLDLLTGANAFQRDQSRLDEKQRAIYKQQGLELEDGETITNILADNITIGGRDKEAEKETPSLPLTPQPSQPASRTSWLPWLLAAAMGAANLGGAAWVINNMPEPPQQQDSRLTIGLETE